MLAVLALIVGAVSGFVGALFLLLLERADRFRDALIVWAHSKAFAGFLVVSIACAAGAAVAAWLVRRYSPHASGSGIPHVEAVLNEELPQAPFRIIPVKFVAGVLAIGSGLALGREGPSCSDGGDHRASGRQGISTRLARLQSVACRRRRGRPGHCFQCSDRRSHFRPGGIGAAFRAARCDSGAWRLGDRHLRVTCAPRRRRRLPCWSVGLC